MIDAKVFGAELAEIVKAATIPLVTRIEALEKQLSERPVPKDGKDGKDADPDEIAKVVSEGFRKEFDDIRAAAEALTGMPDMVSEAVAAAVSEIPPPKDGKDGKDGKDADPDEVARIVSEDFRKEVEGIRAAVETLPEVPDMVSEAVEKHMAELPVPKDGKDGERGPKGDKGDAGHDGAGVADLLIDRDGCLTATFTDGRMKSLGVVVGRDGSPGQDGVGFDDLSVEHDGERTFTMRFQKGARIIENSLVIPATIYRGVYSAGKTYDRGDSVTLGGSQWIALEDTDERPDGSGKWQLAVKRGRDGRDGQMKPPAEPKTVKVK